MSNIAELDSNFKVETKIEKDDLRFFDPRQDPFRIYGVFYEDGKYHRMPEEVARTVSPAVHRLHSHTAGGRIRFQTDSPYVAVHVKLGSVSRYSHAALTLSAGLDIYVRENGEEIWRKTCIPPYENGDEYETVLELNTVQMREITVNFPLYGEVLDLWVGLSNTAQILAPRPYRYEKPVVYYGSSITQGGCASRPGNCYQAFLSRWLDTDYVNLGFSGNAKAEDEIAHYIKGLDMSVFVYDYDHNAPTLEHLKKTHERMFSIIREANPDLPIIMMTRPKYRQGKNELDRIEIIRRTYENAKARGDKNVYLVIGKDLMRLAGHDGTVDVSHPNDLGFYSMATVLRETLQPILEKLEG